MRRWAVLAGVLFATAVRIAPAVQGNKSVLQPGQIRQNLFSACFLNEHEGWISGELGRVFHTKDGGKTFTRSRVNTRRAFTSITCSADKKLFVVGPEGIAMRSMDGGESWEAVQLPVQRTLLSVTFASPDVGVAVGDFGTILRTEDGGTTWAVIPVPEHIPLPEEIAEVINPGDVLLYDVDFVDAQRGWIVGEFGVIFATTDGGLTWAAQTSPVSTTLFGVDFINAQRGFASGLEGVLLRTEDGGVNWNQIPIPAQKGFVLSVYDVAIQNQLGFAVGDSGFLLKTSDGGATWTRVELPIRLAGNWLRGLSLSPSGHGYIVGSDGLILAADRTTVRELKQ